MKKEYVAPQTALFAVELQQMIAQSTLTTDSDSQNLRFDENEEVTNPTSRRGRNQWEDDEDGY